MRADVLRKVPEVALASTRSDTFRKARLYTKGMDAVARRYDRRLHQLHYYYAGAFPLAAEQENDQLGSNLANGDCPTAACCVPRAATSLLLGEATSLLSAVCHMSSQSPCAYRIAGHRHSAAEYVHAT